MRRGLLLAALLWAVPTSAYANPIRITGGSLDIPQPDIASALGILDIVGFDGFHMKAHGDAHNGLGHGCSPACQPGDSLSLAGILISGGYTLLEGGPVPPNPPWRPEGSWLYHIEAGNVTVPPLGTSAVLTAPFVFTGTLTFHHEEFPPRDLHFELYGRGTGTVELRPNPFGTPVWEFARARYEVAPVPEPTTLLLVSSGLAAVAWRRGRRRRATP